ncbi:glycosyltransferase family 2 protein [Candidatus Saccharibacteria bacterium]|nr:glycosyltransferase family 2 protein [Candidatus Saccharibacteria bacterium]
MPEISVIIPVYNASKYLERCLDSILASLESIKGEILAIDNNSTDNSLSILKKYAKNNPKIVTVLECQTPGAAAVRNFGTDKARGRYLWFIDADDYIDKTAIKKLLKKADETGADMVMMGAKRTNEQGEMSYLSAIETNEKDYKSRFIRYGMGPWQVLIRREWYRKCGFRFKEGIIHEDMEMMSALILYTDKFASVDEPLYFYNANPESVLHQKKFNPHIFDIFPALDGLYQRFKDKNTEKKYHDELEWFFIWNLLIDSAKDFQKFPEGKPGFRRSREMLRKYFPNWRKNRFLREKPLKLQIRVRINYKK